MASQNLVALSDVDWAYANKGFAELPAETATPRSASARTSSRSARPHRHERRRVAGHHDAFDDALERERAIALAGGRRHSRPRCRTPRGIRTFDGCSTSRRTSMRWLCLHPTTSTRSFRWRRWTWASTSSARSRCTLGRRGPTVGRRAAEPRVATQMGNQGHSWTMGARGGVRLGRRDRRRDARCTSGRTGRSDSGRKACRGRRR